LSLEEDYDEIRQLIIIGKEKGYLLYDEVIRRKQHLMTLRAYSSAVRAAGS
jgi:hypothetical protein